MTELIEEELAIDVNDNGEITGDNLEEQEEFDDSFLDDPETINEGVEAIDQLITTTLLSDFSRQYLANFRSVNYNKKSPQEREDLFANYFKYISSVFGDEVFFPGIAVIENGTTEESVFFYEDKLIIDKKLFEKKNCGIIILADIVRELRKHLMDELINHAMEIGDYHFYKKLKGKAKLYYENKSESWLSYGWINFYTKEHINYAYQPLIYDATKLQIDILFEVLKELYKQDKNIDKEMVSLLQVCTDFYSNSARDKSERMKIIKKNREAIKAVKNEEKIITEYINRATGDVSKLSDDEFFELFNNSFYSILNSCKFDVCLMLENLCNEVIYRTFKGFDLVGVELPSYSFELDENNIMKMSCLYLGEVSEIEIEDSSEAFRNITHMISILAQKHGFFRFDSKLEEDDYKLMKKWIDIKKEQNIEFDQCDKDVMSDEVNIIILKVGQLLNELEARINESIAKSKLINVGKSMLVYYNNKAHVDFNEFKRCCKKEAVHDCLREYILLDIADMQRKAAR